MATRCLWRRSARILATRGATSCHRPSISVCRLFHNTNSNEQRRGIQNVNDETIVLEGVDEQEASLRHNNITTNDDDDDSTEVWAERLQQALTKHESIDKKENEMAWIESVETIRDCYVNLRYFDDALTMEEQLLDVATTLQDQADCFHRMGSLHLQLQHFDKATRCYEMALQKFYDLHGPASFHSDMGKLLIGLGGICVHSGSPEEALPYLAQAEEHYRNHGSSREEDDTPEYPHDDLTIVLANQAVVYRMLGQHQAAIDKYKEIMAFCSPEEDEKRDELQFQIADCLLTLNQLSPALDHFDTLLDNEIKRRGGEQSAHEGVLRHFIGVIHSKQGRMDDALRELESAYVIKKATFGELHPEVASTLNGLGAVHATLGNDGEALSYFRESLMIARIHAVEEDDKDPQVMQTLRNISLVHGNKVPKWN